MQPTVFEALFGEQEVEAALGAAVGNLHLHTHMQEAIRDARTHSPAGVRVCVCVCRWNTW